MRADEAQTRTREKPINNSLSGFLVAPPTRCAKRLSSAFANGLGFSKGSCKIQSIIMFTVMKFTLEVKNAALEVTLQLTVHNPKIKKGIRG